jgi:3-hydroxyisobutyrate dehydrogenase
MNKSATTIVAVLGLGAMGLPMALRLSETFTVRGFDLTADRIALAADGGIETFDSARAASDGADVVLIAVRNGRQLNDVLFDEESGIATVLKRGSTVMMTSTVGLDAVKHVAALLEDSGIHFVDAPLSGGPARARAGDMLVVVGASPDALETAQPLLDKLASTLSVVGPHAGDGQAFKTVNQLLCGIHIAAAAEALALAESLGLDVAKTLDLLNTGAAASFMLGNRGPRMVEALEGFEPEVLSRLDIFVKDMGIVADASRTNNVPTPLASLAEQMFRIGATRGNGGHDDSTVITVITPDATSD